ncbi:PREDICTED: kremen protein 2 [Dipodomys ordii]|uniref:Kringle-containing protein marking the eye and the nose n=1 Tax=Dipodomys ordii TaxID=10020 RepID=A0A1S3ES00_DIPOR|nr:PREDICTED: kremen protein 2 [Dipodomys ordii]
MALAPVLPPPLSTPPSTLLGSRPGKGGLQVLPGLPPDAPQVVPRWPLDAPQLLPRPPPQWRPARSWKPPDPNVFLGGLGFEGGRAGRGLRGSRDDPTPPRPAPVLRRSAGLSECFQVNGADYRGHQNHTGPRGAGRPCLFWDQTQQHSYSSASDPQGRWGLGAHNFCRNPDGDVQPWCYVAETEEGIYWRYCDIPTCHMPGYLGCFVDSGAPPALSGPSGTSTKLTVPVCLRFCRMKGYQLAGVEAGYACFCGSEGDLARGRPAPATDCDQICFGHPGQLCGGDGRLGIYEVSVGSCQGNWTAPQGVVYSPDFPDEYGPDRNCSWLLRPAGAALELTFRLFELADPRDRLELRDAGSGSLLRAFDGAPRVSSTVMAISVLLLLLLSLLRLLRRRSCLLAPGKGPLALGPSRGPGRSWAVWYRRPRGVALPCPPGDPQAEGPAAGYRPLSASSQSSLRSLISAL